jgi:hypothetical protein
MGIRYITQKEPSIDDDLILDDLQRLLVQAKQSGDLAAPRTPAVKCDSTALPMTCGDYDAYPRSILRSESSGQLPDLSFYAFVYCSFPLISVKMKMQAVENKSRLPRALESDSQ